MEQLVIEPIDDARWATVQARERDDRFVYAVRTTSIYCRPGCPSRTPARRNVVAFGDAAAAAAAGFRACKRCAPDDVAADADRVRLIHRACELLAAGEAPALETVAREIGLSRFHFQRIFRRVVGVTPGAYVRAHRAERFRSRLASGATVTKAVQDAGYGSASRSYASAPLGMTPARYRAGGRGERVLFAIAPCALGRVLVATTERGVCAIELGDDDDAVVAALRGHMPNADVRRDDSSLRATVDAVVALVDDPAAPCALPLDVRGTVFQQRVWNALRAVRPGAPVSYATLARAVGSPRGAQAVGAACAANRLAVAIPCHRAVREDGALAGYRWGLERKRALLARERGA
ncbi:MAG: AraC family transcriptional regulator [Candidatus Eremiobacteraeota bacterium]|jgi:AraC family transcriptional regulator of adaptative response/methylated-DNA-[protein]-cysteine methyltransferase|nr:AraC family transcriptional regulator [Candidatus Eremiobacteraeota bacterium]